MTLFQYISSFVAFLFILFYYIWRRNKNEVIPNWPIIGMLPSILRNKSDIHNFVTKILKHHGGTLHFTGPWFTNVANFILTSDPINVNYILNKNFRNYGKGSDFHDIFEILGDGIFNMELNEWKQESTLFHSVLKMKNLKIFHHQNIEKKLVNCLLPFLDHASKGVQVHDLQNIFVRFTFDINCTFLFGFDPNSFPSKFHEFSDNVCIKALSVLEEIVLTRHYIPKCIWKLQKWLQIGEEKRAKVAKEYVHQFLDECISKCNEDVDESHSFLIKELLKERPGKGEKAERYIRDTALNILFAGNGTVSSGLCWFFWLVSTHPTVEAKIIQEIKEICLTQKENLISNLCMEDLDKLVYLHGAVCEALRLYPPLAFQHRCAIKSDILPGGDHVSPNTKLIYSLYAMGRMEQIWGKDCLEFKPERWISERGKIIHVPSYKFIAFNAGPRSCLGEGMTFVQMKMVATYVLWNYKLQVMEGQSIIAAVSVALRMKHGFKVIVSKRSI